MRTQARCSDHRGQWGVHESPEGHVERPVRLRWLAEALRCSLQILGECGWVRTDATGSLHGVGIRARLTGTSRLDSDLYVHAARPYLDEAWDALGETIHLVRLGGSDMVHLATRESHDDLRTINRVSRRTPATARRARRCSRSLPTTNSCSGTSPLRALTANT